MSKIRAYKLAEELGLDRVEFVEKAAAAGVELKSAMAQIEEDVAQDLRDKLGSAKPGNTVVTERRVLATGGGAVIRRRRKAADPEPVAPEEPVSSEPEPALEPIAAEADTAQPSELDAAASAGPEPIAARAAPASEEAGKSTQPGPRPGSAAPAPERPAGADKSGADKSGADKAGADKAGKQRKLVREVVNLREQERLARQAVGRSPLRRHVTVDPRQVQSPRRRRRDAPAKPAPKVEPKVVQRVVRIDGTVSVGELARMLGAKGPDVQRKLMALGTMVSINQSLDSETATKVAAEYGYELQDVGFDEQEFIAAPEGAEADASRVSRPPVITVMGHVDHGKTSLLDAIRKADVVSGEAGGITQHIGAYRTSVDGHPLTFIDTPGHAAFTEMRARGAGITDLVILVVAGTEGIMPQTIEAIEHSKAAGVPIVVAINKMDLPGANSQQTRQRLMEHGLVSEDFGGDTICVDVSATTGAGLEKLLEMIQLQAELLELKADPGRRAAGVVIEAALDKGRGPVATILVHEGTLRRGDIVVVGTSWGRIRAMADENVVRMVEAGPSVPVQITGLSSVPEAGQPLNAVENERVAKDIIAHRESEVRGRPVAGRPMLTLDEIFARAEGGGIKELPVVIKADAQGSVEALRDSLLKLSTDAVKVDVLLAGVGAVNETDVMLAKASNAIIVAFHVRPDPAARKEAESQGVEIRAYQIIYEVIDEIKLAMAGLLPPTVSEAFQGRAEVRDTFTVPKVGTIAGCYVVEGNVRRGAHCRLLRDSVQIFEGRVGSLKRFKDDVREVATGFECGIGIDGYNDIKIGDVIESYVLEEKPATLE